MHLPRFWSSHWESPRPRSWPTSRSGLASRSPHTQTRCPWTRGRRCSQGASGTWGELQGERRKTRRWCYTQRKRPDRLTQPARHQEMGGGLGHEWQQRRQQFAAQLWQTQVGSSSRITSGPGWMGLGADWDSGRCDLIAFLSWRFSANAFPHPQDEIPNNCNLSL